MTDSKNLVKIQGQAQQKGKLQDKLSNTRDLVNRLAYHSELSHEIEKIHATPAIVRWKIQKFYPGEFLTAFEGKDCARMYALSPSHVVKSHIVLN